MKVKYVILIIICFAFLGCKKEEEKEKIYTEKPDEVAINTLAEIAVYDEVYLHDLITISGGKINSDNTLIDVSTVGTKQLTFNYTYDSKKYVYAFSVLVIDSTPPKILGGGSKTVVVNYEDDLCNLVMYGDNYDRKPNCVIVGEYDVNTIGKYQLKYIITDSSNNKAETDVTLNVVAKTNNSGASNKTRLMFNDIIKEYKTDNNEIGIDVSKWQEDIDFAKVKEAGATFVMMRLGVQKIASGDLEMDAYYLQNIKNAKEVGLKVGVYLYSIATSEEEAIMQAKWVIDKLDGVDLDLPVVFDWEMWGKWNSYNLSFYDINNIADSFIKTVKDNGYEGMLYSSKYYLENIWENKLNHKVWLAHYTKNTTYAGEYVIWQMSDAGRIPGIKNDVDINILYH